MKLLSKKLASNIIVNGKDIGLSLVRLLNKELKQTILLNIYYRDYQNKQYQIAKIEIYDKNTKKYILKFYEVNQDDYTTEDSKTVWENTFTGLKNALNDVVDLLKNEK